MGSEHKQGIGRRIATWFFEGDQHEKTKLLLLTLTFFCIISGYTLAKELKDAVFTTIVGKDYQPRAKYLTLFMLIPATFLYSFFVDRLRRYQLLCLYSLIFGLLGVLFAYLLGHPTIGLSNTAAGPHRLFGWIFYIFVESYSPFLVGVFWAFANSVNSADGAKKNYPYMVAGSKIGGMLSIVMALCMLKLKNSAGGQLLSDITAHQVLLVYASMFVLMVPLTILYLMRLVPGRYLHGHEATYQLEKERSREGKSETGVFSGLKMFVQYPYVLGIFLMLFFYEIINTVLGFERLGIAQEASCGSMCQFTGYLFWLSLATHFTGFVFALFGTKTLMKRLGERLCLMLIPILTGVVCLVCFSLGLNTMTLLIIFVGVRAINYSFSYPVRESLYIPTVKEMKFKSKAWIDTFGSKFAKFMGSGFNDLTGILGAAWTGPLRIVFFGGIVVSWFFTSVLLGRRFEKAVRNNEIIGADVADPAVAEGYGGHSGPV